MQGLVGPRALPVDIEMLLGVQTPSLSCETRRALFMHIAYNSQAIVDNLLGPFSGHSRHFYPKVLFFPEIFVRSAPQNAVFPMILFALHPKMLFFQGFRNTPTVGPRPTKKIKKP